MSGLERTDGRDRDDAGHFETSVFVPEDLETILAIENEAFADDTYPAEMFVGSHRAPDQRFLVVRHDRELIGYIISLLRQNNGYIVSMAVRQAFQRRGVASLLMQHALTAMRAAEITDVYLHVGQTNFAALALYRKFGFAASGVHRHYYADGTDALVMTGAVDSLCRV